MYIDLFLDSNGYSAIIYRVGASENIRSKNMELLAKYIGNRISSSDEVCYIDQRGAGMYLTDCLDKEGVCYKPMGHLKFINIDKIVDDTDDSKS